jgi:hypothetical protein
MVNQSSVKTLGIIGVIATCLAGCSGNVELGHDNQHTSAGAVAGGGLSIGGGTASDVGGSPAVGGSTAAGGSAISLAGGSPAGGSTIGGSSTEVRMPFSARCARSSGSACTEDSDCTNGGCGGELCYNPALGEVVTTCDCAAPTTASCGCVDGVCAWWTQG